jgi:hypothetical protein
MAQKWLRLISTVEPAESQFDAAGDTLIRQTKSEESH